MKELQELRDQLAQAVYELMNAEYPIHLIEKDVQAAISDWLYANSLD